MIDATIEDGQITNLEAILNNLGSKPIFHGYGRVTGAVYYDVNFKDMLDFARNAEKAGYIPFGAPSKQYCAKFARQVAKSGGAKFGVNVFTGQQNVNATLRRNR